jgi:hypothetical protein
MVILNYAEGDFMAPRNILLGKIPTDFVYIIILINIIIGLRLSQVVTAASIDLLYQPQMIDYDECGIVGGSRSRVETEVFGQNLPQYGATVSTTNTT